MAAGRGGCVRIIAIKQHTDPFIPRKARDIFHRAVDKHQDIRVIGVLVRICQQDRLHRIMRPASPAMGQKTVIRKGPEMAIEEIQTIRVLPAKPNFPLPGHGAFQQWRKRRLQRCFGQMVEQHIAQIMPSGLWRLGLPSCRNITIIRMIPQHPTTAPKKSNRGQTTGLAAATDPKSNPGLAPQHVIDIPGYLTRLIGQNTGVG